MSKYNLAAGCEEILRKAGFGVIHASGGAGALRLGFATAAVRTFRSLTGTTVSKGVLVFAILCLVVTGAQAQTSRESKAKNLIKKRLAKSKPDVGIVVGLIDEQGNTKVVSAAGGTNGSANAAFDGDTVFEIGSVTKVFTSLLLADMVTKGEVMLDDSISKYLPKTVKAPSRSGREITLVDLATHTSGLPRLPLNIESKDPDNPYADYTVEQLYAFLSDYKLPRDIGTKYEYSNLGGGLLGHLLALRVGKDYESLVRERICKPLGMNDTEITLTPELKTRLAKGHDEREKAVENWDIPTLAGAGALRSTANDLLKFVKANMGLVKTEMQPAMELAQKPRHETDSSVMQIGLGWHIFKKSEGNVVWHNGGTGGYHSFIGFDVNSKLGVVVLANSAKDIDDIGLQLLEGKKAGPKQHIAVEFEPGGFDVYVGNYQLAPGVVLAMKREGGRFYTKMTGQSWLEIFPESPTDFFLKDVDAQLTFRKGASGEVVDVTLHQNGFDQVAKKVK